VFPTRRRLGSGTSSPYQRLQAQRLGLCPQQFSAEPKAPIEGCNESRGQTRSLLESCLSFAARPLFQPMFQPTSDVWIHRCSWSSGRPFLRTLAQ
jgi:hypothetical protein